MAIRTVPSHCLLLYTSQSFLSSFLLGRRRWGKKAITQLPIVCVCVCLGVVLCIYSFFLSRYVRACPFPDARRPDAAHLPLISTPFFSPFADHQT